MSFNLLFIGSSNSDKYNITVNGEIFVFGTPLSFPRNEDLIIEFETIEGYQFRLDDSQNQYYWARITSRIKLRQFYLLDGEGNNTYRKITVPYDEDDISAQGSLIFDIDRMTIDEVVILPDLEFHLEGCSTNWEGDRIVWTTPQEGVINIVADEGFKIDTCLYSQQGDDRGDENFYDIFETFLSEDEKEVNIILADLKDIVKGTLSDSSLNGYLYQRIYATVIEDVSDVGDDWEQFKSNEFIRSYVGDMDFLNLFSYLYYTGDDNIEGDLINTIDKVYAIPFKIDESLINSTSRKVFLGHAESPIDGYLLETSTLIYDFGVISIPKIYDNVYDYKNTECILHLPFIDPREIDVFKVVGYDIHCRLFIDIYTGQGTYILTSDSIDNNILLKFTVEVGYEVPILSRNRLMIINNVDEYNYNIDYLFKIEVNRSKPIINDNIKPNLIYDVIGNYTGNVKVREVELKGNSNYNEKVELKNLLNEGVIIK